MKDSGTTRNDSARPPPGGTPRWKRRVLVGLLLVAALVAGWWWNAKRLNATERQLVGVWEFVYEENTTVPGKKLEALMLLRDRRRFAFVNVVSLADVPKDNWITVKDFDRWRASPTSFSQRPPLQPPATASPKLWWKFFKAVVRGNAWEKWTVIDITEREIELSGTRSVLPLMEYGLISSESVQFSKQVLRRSGDPVLLRIFDRLSAGETPEQIEAGDPLSVP